MKIKYNHFKLKLLWITILIVDITNGILVELGNIVGTEGGKMLAGYPALVVPGGIYLIVGVMYVIYLLYNNKNLLKTSTSTYILETLLSSSVCIGSLFYFVGDNLASLYENIGESDKKITEIDNIRPYLLIISIIFYRLIPYAIDNRLNKLENDTSNSSQGTSETGVETLSTDSEGKSICKSMFEEVVKAAAMTVEFDSWFTVVLTASLCTSNTQLVCVWVLYCFMVIVYLVILLLNIDTCVIEAHGHRWHCHTCHNIFLGFSLSVALGTYLVADNMRPLSCHFEATPTKLKLSLLLVAGVVYLTLFIASSLHCTCS